MVNLGVSFESNDGKWMISAQGRGRAPAIERNVERHAEKN